MSRRDEFLERCAGIAGAAIGDGVFASSLAVWVGKREIAHFDADRTLDVRLTRSVIRSRRQDFAADERFALRKGVSDWLEFNISTEADWDCAFALVEDAVAANIGTAKPGPPPTGADLQRRRRFH